ncbi:MAG: InlB B-repeat-containing protein, partial [Candidatus Scatosoma sp.]
YYVGGASVRYDWTDENKTGIRFQTLIKKDIYDSLVAEYGENFKTGTLILPADILNGAELTKNVTNVDDTNTTGKWAVKSVDGTQYMESWTYLYNIPEHSYNRGLSVRGYLSLNGLTVYTDNTLVRSLSGVAYVEKNTEGISQGKLDMLEKYLKTYTVEFADENGVKYSSIASQSVVYGEKITVPDEPVKEGYVFAGWTLNGKMFNPETDYVKGNTVLRAIFVVA